MLFETAKLLENAAILEDVIPKFEEKTDLFEFSIFLLELKYIVFDQEFNVVSVYVLELIMSPVDVLIFPITSKGCVGVVVPIASPAEVNLALSVPSPLTSCVENEIAPLSHALKTSCPGCCDANLPLGTIIGAFCHAFEVPNNMKEELLVVKASC